MKRLLLSMLMLGLGIFTYAQEVWEIKDVTNSWKDVLGHYYFEINQELLIKTNDKGEVVAKKTASRSGRIGNVDVLNPFKVIVYYPRVKKIQVLDADFSTLQEVNLRTFMDWDIRAVGSTKDGFLVLLDAYNNQWIRMDEHGNHSLIGVSFEFLNLDWNDFVRLETNAFYWALIFKDKVYVFDNYGAHINSFPLIKDQSVHLFEDYLYLFAQNELIEEHIRTLSRKSISLSIEGDWRGWGVERNRLILYYSDRIQFKTLK